MVTLVFILLLFRLHRLTETFIYLFIYLGHAAQLSGILVPPPGTEPWATAMKAPGPNRWTMREVPWLKLLNTPLYLLEGNLISWEKYFLTESIFFFREVYLYAHLSKNDNYCVTITRLTYWKPFFGIRRKSSCLH